MLKAMMTGVDLAKNVFEIHAASMPGELLCRRKLSRQSIPEFVAGQLPA